VRGVKIPAILIFFIAKRRLSRRRGAAQYPSSPWTRPERKSETTLGIAGLHFEIGAFPGAAPDQFELPPRASNAGHRQRSCGEDGDPPAGDRCRRLAEIGRLCRPPPAADGEADGARATGSYAILDHDLCIHQKGNPTVIVGRHLLLPDAPEIIGKATSIQINERRAVNSRAIPSGPTECRTPS
jgi:hypothetical protein